MCLDHYHFVGLLQHFAQTALLVILVSDVLNQRLVDPEVLILSVAGLAGVSCCMYVDQACVLV